MTTYVNISEIAPKKPNLIIVNKIGYYADEYIMMVDGSFLLANINPNSKFIIVSKLGLDGTVVHEFASDVTMEDFLELQSQTMHAVAEPSGVDLDEDGEGIVDPEFSTALVDNRDYV